MEGVYPLIHRAGFTLIGMGKGSLAGCGGGRVLGKQRQAGMRNAELLASARRQKKGGSLTPAQQGVECLGTLGGLKGEENPLYVHHLPTLVHGHGRHGEHVELHSIPLLELTHPGVDHSGEDPELSP